MKTIVRKHWMIIRKGDLQRESETLLKTTPYGPIM